jgi:hypothetical protein
MESKDSIRVESVDYLCGFYENYKNHSNMWIVCGLKKLNLGVSTAKKKIHGICGTSMESMNPHGLHKDYLGE